MGLSPMSAAPRPTQYKRAELSATLTSQGNVRADIVANFGAQHDVPQSNEALLTISGIRTEACTI